jgi:hypothetical protein
MLKAQKIEVNEAWFRKPKADFVLIYYLLRKSTLQISLVRVAYN